MPRAAVRQQRGTELLAREGLAEHAVEAVGQDCGAARTRQFFLFDLNLFEWS